MATDGYMKGADGMQNNKGFTLVEVLISISILAIATAAVLSVIGANTRINARSFERQNLNMVMQEWMERIKMYTGSDIGVFLDDNGWVENPEVLGEYIYTVNENGLIGTLHLTENTSFGDYPVRGDPVYGYEIDVETINDKSKYDFLIEGASGSEEIIIDKVGSIDVIQGIVSEAGEKNTSGDGIRVIYYKLGRTATGSTLTIKNLTQNHYCIYIIQNKYELGFPEVKVEKGRVQVINNVVFSESSIQPSGSYDVLKNVTITADVLIDNAVRDDYLTINGTRIVR